MEHFAVPAQFFFVITPTEMANLNFQAIAGVVAAGLQQALQSNIASPASSSAQTPVSNL